MPTVVLTDEQVNYATQVALDRMSSSIEMDLKHSFNAARMANPEYDKAINIQGAIAEYAVSLKYDLPWNGSKQFKGVDVGQFEVRSQARNTKEYLLYVRKWDKDALYIYCVVDSPTVVIAGWASAFQVRTDGKLCFPEQECYGLARAKLQSMEQLLEVAEFTGRKC